MPRAACFATTTGTPRENYDSNFWTLRGLRESAARHCGMTAEGSADAALLLPPLPPSRSFLMCPPSLESAENCNCCASFSS